MKRLILVRHAKSCWENTDLPDFERPLNHRGLTSAPKMADILAGLVKPPDLIITSPAVRAQSTAGIFAAGLGIKASNIQSVSDLYEAEAVSLLKIVQQLPDNLSAVCLIGHNPGLTEFINQSCDLAIENFPTAAVMVIDFDSATWKKIEWSQTERSEIEQNLVPQKQGAVRFYICPKILKQI
jgi:phosphohistidine phosphatase